MQHKKKRSKNHKKHDSLVTSTITLTKSGTGFVTHPHFDTDIRISHDDLHTALHGDTVEVLVGPKMPRSTRRSGIVRNVTERKRMQFVGEIVHEKGTWMVRADDPRVYTPLVLTDMPADVPAGYKALVEMQPWTKPEAAPRAVLRNILGPAGLHETEMQAILLERGFESGFPAAVESEAQAMLEHRDVTEEELEWREDIREILTMTIDPHDAKDFDDALSVRTLENGNTEVGIHIADVTHYVRSGTALEQEAQRRATSVYLVDRTIPMLPEVLSNDLCSLNPNEDKRAFSVFFEMTPEAEVAAHRFAKTLIRSDKRFTYKEAQNVLDTSSGPHVDELITLQTLAQHLRAQRVKNGAIEFDTDEIQFELDANGAPLRAYVKERLETMKLIEEFMLLANRYVATHLSKCSSGKTSAARLGIYRTHDVPDPDKLADLNIFLRALGYDHLDKEPSAIRAKDLARLIRDVQGTPEQTVIQTATLRSMQKAVYSDKNIGHFSLGFEYYTHFTSPIRRYPDMMVHRLLFAHLDKSPMSSEELMRYRTLATSSSQREVEAVDAERASVKLKQVEYMHARIGQTFTGTVTGVTQSGMFIAEDTTKAEGLVRAADIPGDWYEINEKHYTLVGRKTGKSYRIGDGVKMKLKAVNLDSREIDWEII